jgi:hypothetical protein
MSLAGKSATLGIIVVFAGYAVASYGVVLLRGWNISFRAWVDPLHAYTWPADGSPPLPIPQTQVFADSLAASVTASPGGALAGPAAGAAAVSALGGQGTTQAAGTTTAGGRGG